MGLITGYVRQPKAKWPYVAAVIIILLACVIVLLSILSANIPEEDIIIVKEKPQVKVEVKPKVEETTTTTTTTTTITTTVPLKPEPKVVMNQNAEINVEKIIFTSKIDDNNRPTDDISEVSLSEINKIFCYTKISAGDVPQIIRHIWINPAGSVTADIELRIRNRSAHTWSYIGLSGAMPGKWEVQVRTDEGKIIATRSFKIY